MTLLILEIHPFCEMDELHLLRKLFNEIEYYLVSNSTSGDTAHAIVEELPVAVAHYDLDF